MRPIFDKKKFKPSDAVKQLQAEIAEVKTSDDYKAHLDLMTNYHGKRYSFRNQWMIAWQRPGASLVAGFKTWEKLNRRPKKNTAINILAPRFYKQFEQDADGNNTDTVAAEGIYFIYVRVFAIEDTYLIDESKGDPVQDKMLSIETKQDSAFVPNLLALCSELNIKTEFVADLYAYGVSTGGLVQIRDEQSTADKASTLIHEIAHELLHQNDENRRTMSKAQVEHEAEAVAYAVCKRFGIPINSAVYLAGYNEYDLTESLPRIGKIAYEIIGRLEKINGDNPGIGNTENGN